MTNPFSSIEVEQAKKYFKGKDPEFLRTSDNVKLAYYPFVSNQPKKVIVFYHGGGAWSMAMYQLMAKQICQSHPVAVYLVDIRGHGNSEGSRGDAPSSQRIWDDVDDILSFIENRHKGTPIILAGHSSGAGLIINYLAQSKNSIVERCIFISPFLGDDTDINIKHSEADKSFINKVKNLVLILHVLSGKRLFKHTPSVYFNYGNLRESDPLLLHYYTCAMALAVFPRNIQEILSNIKIPCSIFIGENDECFNPKRMVELTKNINSDIHPIAKVVPGANHLSIVLKVPELFNEH